MEMDQSIALLQTAEFETCPGGEGVSAELVVFDFESVSALDLCETCRGGWDCT